MRVALLTRTVTFQNGAVVPYALDLCATEEIAKERAGMGQQEIERWLGARTELGFTVEQLLLKLGIVGIHFEGHPSSEIRTSNLAVPKPVIIMPGNGRG